MTKFQCPSSGFATPTNSPQPENKIDRLCSDTSSNPFMMEDQIEESGNEPAPEIPPRKQSPAHFEPLWKSKCDRKPSIPKTPPRKYDLSPYGRGLSELDSFEGFSFKPNSENGIKTPIPPITSRKHSLSPYGRGLSEFDFLDDSRSRRSTKATKFEPDAEKVMEDSPTDSTGWRSKYKTPENKRKANYRNTSDGDYAPRYSQHQGRTSSMSPDKDRDLRDLDFEEEESPTVNNWLSTNRTRQFDRPVSERSPTRKSSRRTTAPDVPPADETPNEPTYSRNDEGSTVDELRIDRDHHQSPIRPKGWEKKTSVSFHKDEKPDAITPSRNRSATRFPNPRDLEILGLMNTDMSASSESEKYSSESELGKQPAKMKPFNYPVYCSPLSSPESHRSTGSGGDFGGFVRSIHQGNLEVYTPGPDGNHELVEHSSSHPAEDRSGDLADDEDSSFEMVTHLYTIDPTSPYLEISRETSPELSIPGSWPSGLRSKKAPSVDICTSTEYNNDLLFFVENENEPSTTPFIASSPNQVLSTKSRSLSEIIDESCFEEAWSSDDEMNDQTGFQEGESNKCDQPNNSYAFEGYPFRYLDVGTKPNDPNDPKQPL